MATKDPKSNEPSAKKAKPKRKASSRKSSPPQVISFGGGKGGVGRSVLTANVGVYLAQLGKRVVLFDADFGGANLHTILGLDVPDKTLSDVLLRKRESLEEIVLETPISGLGLISGAGDIMSVGAPRSAERNRFIQMIFELDVDYVLFDLRAGTQIELLDLFLLANTGVVVLTPEPTSVENAYRFIKSAFYRKLWKQEAYKSLRGLLTDAHGAVQEFGFMSPPSFLEQVQRRFPDLVASLVDEIHGFSPQILVNMCRTRRDAELGDAIGSACRRKLHLDVGCLGHVDYDDAAWLSVQKRRPMLLEFPGAKPSGNLEMIARNLLSLEATRRGRRRRAERTAPLAPWSAPDTLPEAPAEER